MHAEMLNTTHGHIHNAWTTKIKHSYHMCYVYTVYVVYSVVTLIWQFYESCKDRQINWMPLLSQVWISFHTALKFANLKSHQ